MPEKCRKYGQFPLNVFSRSIPIDQRLDRETMTEIMNARSIALSLLPKSDLP
jgi:hypothetical protein